MRTMKIWLLICGVAFLHACATMGPIDAPDFLPTVQKALLAEDGAVRIAHHGAWHPNVKGFNDVRANGLNILFGDLPPKIDGVVAISDISLSFLEWNPDKKQYDVIKRIAFADLRQAEVEILHGYKRMVFRSKDLSYQTFFLYDTAANPTLSDQVIALVKAKIPKS